MDRKFIKIFVKQINIVQVVNSCVLRRNLDIPAKGALPIILSNPQTSL